MFNIFQKKKKIKGSLEYYDLVDWWSETFTDQEKRHIEDVFHPLGSDPNDRPLTQGDLSYSSQSASGLLSALAGWFNNSKDRYLAKKIIEKAYELAKSENNVLDLHFVLSEMITIYYRERNDNSASLERSIEACEEQIEIAPDAAKAYMYEYQDEFGLPAHNGFKQLSIIYKKQGDFEKVVSLAKNAKEQGWAGDWDKRIAFAMKKINTNL